MMLQVYSDGLQPQLLGHLMIDIRPGADRVEIDMGGMNWMMLPLSKMKKSLDNNIVRGMVSPWNTTVNPFNGIPLTAEKFENPATDSMTYVWQIATVGLELYEELFDHDQFYPEGDAYTLSNGGWYTIDETAPVDWSKWTSTTTAAPYITAGATTAPVAITNGETVVFTTNNTFTID